MIRRILAPSGPLLGAVAIAKSEESADGKKEKNFICKPSALPIYTSLVDRWLSRRRRFLSRSLTTISFWLLADAKLTRTANHQSSLKPSRKEWEVLGKRWRKWPTSMILRKRSSIDFTLKRWRTLSVSPKFSFFTSATMHKSIFWSLQTSEITFKKKTTHFPELEQSRLVDLLVLFSAFVAVSSGNSSTDLWLRPVSLPFATRVKLKNTRQLLTISVMESSQAKSVKRIFPSSQRPSAKLRTTSSVSTTWRTTPPSAARNERALKLFKADSNWNHEKRWNKETH